MTNKRILAGATALALMGAAVPALAQSPEPVGLSVRGGLFIPLDTRARDTATNMVAFGAEFRLRDIALNTQEVSPQFTYR